MLSQWVGKEFHFDAAHYIPGHNKCGGVHGHTWKVTVEIKGEVQDDGMVLDLNTLSRIVKGIIEIFDHKLLNDVIGFIPTCENLADYFVSRVYIHLRAERIKLPKSVRVKVQEGEGGWAIAQE